MHEIPNSEAFTFAIIWLIGAFASLVGTVNDSNYRFSWRLLGAIGCGGFLATAEEVAIKQLCQIPLSSIKRIVYIAKNEPTAFTLEQGEEELSQFWELNGSVSLEYREEYEAQSLVAGTRSKKQADDVSRSDSLRSMP